MQIYHEPVHLKINVNNKAYQFIPIPVSTIYSIPYPKFNKQSFSLVCTVITPQNDISKCCDLSTTLYKPNYTCRCTQSSNNSEIPYNTRI